MIKRLAWVTTREARGRDDDEPLALAALERRGVDVDVIDWGDESAHWDSYDRVVLRSTWDYTQRLTEFLAWLDAVAEVTELINPAPLVRWNLDKHYLRELDLAKVAITSTTFVERGEEFVLPPGDFVVKPAVGAGSRDVASYAAGQHDFALAHISRLHGRAESAMIQPLISSVALHGEWPLVFFNGHYSHSANKRVSLPRAGQIDGLFATEAMQAHNATPAQIEVAQAAVDLVSSRFGSPAYARVDLVRDEQHNYCLLELELIEASLFLSQADPGAIARLVDALTR